MYAPHKIFKAYSHRSTWDGGAMLVMYAGTCFDEQEIIKHILDRYSNTEIIICNREVIWCKAGSEWVAKRLKYKMRKDATAGIDSK